METKHKNNTRDDTEYESYSDTCKVYDIRRKAIGVDYITDAIDEVRFFFFFFSLSNAKTPTQNRSSEKRDVKERILFF